VEYENKPYIYQDRQVCAPPELLLPVKTQRETYPLRGLSLEIKGTVLEGNNFGPVDVKGLNQTRKTWDFIFWGEL
jgi:hypothetical protein